MDIKDGILLDKLFKVSPVGINVVDLKSRQLVEASEWVVNHMGYSEEEYLGLSHNLFESIVHPDDREHQLEAYARLMDDPSILFTECTLRYRTKSGDYLHAMVRLSVLEVDDHKKPIAALNTATDITEIVELRQRLNTELKKLEIISYKNSHELRGPVATILGLIQLIDYHGMSGTECMEIISALKDTVRKLDQVIAEITEHSY